MVCLGVSLASAHVSLCLWAAYGGMVVCLGVILAPAVVSSVIVQGNDFGTACKISHS